MSEILRAETEAIVNLAEYLTNLNSRIENLSGPLCQLHEEIMVSSVYNKCLIVTVFTTLEIITFAFSSALVSHSVYCSLSS